jgi:hypothetical protein
VLFHLLFLPPDHFRLHFNRFVGAIPKSLHLELESLIPTDACYNHVLTNPKVRKKTATQLIRRITTVTGRRYRKSNLSRLFSELSFHSLFRLLAERGPRNFISVFRKLAGGLVNVMKLFFVTLAPAANQKVEAFLYPHQRWHWLVH